MYRNYDLKRKCLRKFGIKATKINIRRKTARRWKDILNGVCRYELSAS